jgi:hypothetical protein
MELDFEVPNKIETGITRELQCSLFTSGTWNWRRCSVAPPELKAGGEEQGPTGRVKTELVTVRGGAAAPGEMATESAIWAATNKTDSSQTGERREHRPGSGIVVVMSPPFKRTVSRNQDYYGAPLPK